MMLFPPFRLSLNLLLKLCTHFTFWRRLGTGGGDVGKKRCCFSLWTTLPGSPACCFTLVHKPRFWNRLTDFVIMSYILQRSRKWFVQWKIYPAWGLSEREEPERCAQRTKPVQFPRKGGLQHGLTFLRRDLHLRLAIILRQIISFFEIT